MSNEQVKEICDSALMIIFCKDREIRKIQEFIKEHYLEMYELWKTDSENGFYGENK